MAYSQQDRYGAPQRPPYGQPEPPYHPSRSREPAQSDGNGTYLYNEGYGNGSDQHYPDQYGTMGESGYDQYNRSQAPVQYQRNDAYYAGRGQHPDRTGRLDQHQYSGPAARTGLEPADPRNHQALPYNNRQAADGQQGRQHHHDQVRGHRRPPDSRQPYDRYQNVVPPQAKGEMAYSEPFDEPQDAWQEQQRFDDGHHSHYIAHQQDERYRGHQQTQAEYDVGHDHGRSHEAHYDPPQSKYNPPGAPKVGHPKTSSGTEEPKQTKQAPKRILDDIKSPDTVAWDNPFPTFPAVRTKNKANGEVNEHGQTERRSSGQHIVTSKSNDNSAHHNGTRENNSDPDTGQDGHAQPPSRPRTDPKSPDQAQERPSTSHTSHSAPRKDKSNTSGFSDRHSEDTRTRPPVANLVPHGSGYERSHIMPVAITDAIVNPHDEMPEVAAWQEPGATAGYYGGEDKGFVSGSPGGIFQQHSTVQLRTHSEGSHQDQPKSRFPRQPAQQLAPAPQPHVQQDSLGEVFDSYYAGTSMQTKPYIKNTPYQRRRESFDELPNFAAAQTVGPSQTREMTIDQHLQPQVATPAQYLPARGPYADQRQHPAHTYGVDPVPRSKSQPDFNGQYRSQQGQGFDFGVPDAAEPRPATSSNGRSAIHGQHPSAPSKDRHYQDSHIRGQHYGAAVPASDQWSRERPSGHGYQDNRRQPNNHQAPPIQNGYGDPRKQDGYRSPPQTNGPYHGPQQPDRFWSPSQQPEPNQRPGQQDRYRSSPALNSRPSDDRVRRPGGASGGPSPQNRNGPTSPPNKPLPNPDALPHHPAPVRPGLIGASPVNSGNKPPPVRQYNTNSSPVTLAGPTAAPGSGRSREEKRGPDPVTYQELDRLRQKMQSSPEDQATRFLLAKKLVEASTVLVNERTDQKTRDKAREDYIAQALKMLKKLSSNQYPDAMFYLGDCYSRGALGLQSDVKEAFTLYQSAAKANHAQAAYRVAVCCEMGQDEGGGTRKDPIKAMQWYKRAAQLGDVPAMYKMGVIQLKGLLGQPRNPREALVFLKKAAERADAENPHALHELGLLHEKGSDGIPKDETYSRDLFVQCANLGYKFSQFRMGCAYEYGLMGCPVDPRQSIAWYSKAAVQEEHQSELSLSGWYLTGSEGVLQQSDTEAYLWARKAAQAGLAKAEYAMGYFTEVGIGAPANLEDAKRWYWRAASQNFPKARERLEDLRKGGAAKQKTRVSRSHMKKQSDGECSVM